MREYYKKIPIIIITAILCITLTNCGYVDNTEQEQNDTLSASDNEAVFETEKLTMSIAAYGEKILEDNYIRGIIAQKTGVDLEENWLKQGQSSTEYVTAIIESGDYPDLINGGDAMQYLYNEGVLVPWDEYIERYPNIKELYSDEEWDLFRQEDGHIYWANVFDNTYGESKQTMHNDYAFWIQVRVLEWDNYPVIETLDEYFDLLERYSKANPTMPDGTEIIPYTVLCEDWRYYCIESAPVYLNGYLMAAGSLAVDGIDSQGTRIIDYDTMPAAQEYFRKLNEEYLAGYIDQEFASQTYNEYIEKLKTGCVLGMSDQFWNFEYAISEAFAENGLDEMGCDYVPLALSLESGQTTRYHMYGDTINYFSGIAVTTSCKNPEIAFKFLNDVLDQEIHDLRFWGIEGEDYLVDEDGCYYRTEEMREKWLDPEYQKEHCCQYLYLPQWLGTSKDGINAMQPQEQPSEFYTTVSKPLSDCFKAYGAGGYADMLMSDKNYCQSDLLPLYDFGDHYPPTDGEIACEMIVECKHEWIPQLVVATDFDAAWELYMISYAECNPQAYIDEMQDELNRRMGL